MKFFYRKQSRATFLWIFLQLANFFYNFHFLDLSQIKVSCVFVLITVSEKFQVSKFVRFVSFMESCNKSKPRNNKLKLNYITSIIVIIAYKITADSVYVALVHVSRHCQLIITVKQNGVVCVVY